jgi:hypothetical protein
MIETENLFQDEIKINSITLESREPAVLKIQFANTGEFFCSKKDGKDLMINKSYDLCVEAERKIGSVDFYFSTFEISELRKDIDFDDNIVVTFSKMSSFGTGSVTVDSYESKFSLIVEPNEENLKKYKIGNTFHVSLNNIFHVNLNNVLK